MFRALTVALVAAGTVWGLADRADAFHGKVRARCIAYYPGLYSYGYCGCPPCPPPPYTYPCSWSYPKYCAGGCWSGRLLCATGCPKKRHCFGSCLFGHGCFGCGVGGSAACGYGYCGSGGSCGGGFCDGGYACGYGSCGGCGDCDGGCIGGCDGGCGSCDGGCAGGCGAGGCSIGGGGCDNCVSGGAPVDGPRSDEKVLYDGPAAGAPVHGEQVPPAPEPDPSAALRRGTPFRLTSNAEEVGGRDGSGDFSRGLRAFWDSNMTDALSGFEAASAAEPANALYRYYAALAVYNTHGADAAADWLSQAVEAERQTPVAGYGRRMERVQGQQRMWIERARQNAGLVK